MVNKRLSNRRQQGYTLIEIMIVIAILGILATLAIPNYQQYIIKTHRTDMMADLQTIATVIESKKMAQGNYADIQINTLPLGNYPKTGKALYQVTISPDPLTADWTLIAQPLPNAQMKNDGKLTLNSQGIKCRETKCSKDWQP